MSYGIQSEHQPNDPAPSADPSGYTPSLEEKKRVKIVTKMFEDGKKYRKKYDENWLWYYKMFRGKQWKDKRPSYRHSEVINLIFREIQSVVPQLTDIRPKFSFIPQEPSDYEFSEILNMLSESDWESKNWNVVLTEAVYDANIYGIGYGEMCFNPKLLDGVGDIEFSSKDLFYAFPDPNATNVNTKANCFVYAEPTDVKVLKREYPDHAKHFKPDMTDLMQGDRTELSEVRFKSPTDTRVVIDGQATYETGNHDRALKITAYYLDDETDEEEQKSMNPETGMEESVFIEKKKYPTGRKTVICNSMVLEDGPNPYEDGKFPYARLLNYMLPREFYGISDIEQLESPQKIFNKLISFTLDVLTLMGNPIWVVGNASGVDTDELFNEPGLVVEADDINQVKREEGVQLQPYVLQLIDRVKNMFDDVSGDADVSRGFRPEGIVAGNAIQSLQEASKTRLRLKSRMMDAFLQECAQMWVSRVMQFRTAPQVYRITGEEGAQKYFKFHVSPVMDETGQPMTDEAGNPMRKATVIPYVQNQEGKMTESLLEAREFQIRGKFDVRITTGSTLPFAKDEKTNLAFKLFESKVIDAEELLTAIDYPNKERVLARARESLAAQQAMMAQGAPGGQPAPQPAPVQ